MDSIKFNDQNKSDIVDKIKDYFERELDQDIGQFDAEFLLDFFAQEVGAYFYNQGLMDAQIAFRSKLDDLESELESLEKSPN